MTLNLKEIWQNICDHWDNSADATLESITESRSSMFEDPPNSAQKLDI